MLTNQKLENEVKRNNLQEDIRITELRYQRANILIDALAEEKDQWISKSEILANKLQFVLGDQTLSAGILTYLGPFSGQYLTEEQAKWYSFVKDKGISLSEGYSLESSIGEPIVLMTWNIKGLSNDSISMEKALTVQKSAKVPLIIDPQGQANKWLKNTESDRLVTTRMDKNSFTKDVEKALNFGLTLMIENCTQEIDPILYPIIQKQTFRSEGLICVKLGDQVTEYKKEFKLLLVTRLKNPHYTPEITSKMNLVNFMITKEGLEDQLL